MGSFDKKMTKSCSVGAQEQNSLLTGVITHTQTHTHSDMRQSNKAEIKTECAQDHEGTIPD